MLHERVTKTKNTKNLTKNAANLCKKEFFFKFYSNQSTDRNSSALKNFLFH